MLKLHPELVDSERSVTYLKIEPDSFSGIFIFLLIFFAHFISLKQQKGYDGLLASEIDEKVEKGQLLKKLLAVFVSKTNKPKLTLF